MHVSLTNPQLLMFQRFYLSSVDRFSNMMSEEQGRESKVLADTIRGAKCGDERLNIFNIFK